MSSRIEVASFTPTATDDEAAAIVAALELLWPMAPGSVDASPSTPPWRFSGRWWSRPVASRRDRPWF